jgi:hypothetical protein
MRSSFSVKVGDVVLLTYVAFLHTLPSIAFWRHPFHILPEDKFLVVLSLTREVWGHYFAVHNRIILLTFLLIIYNRPFFFILRYIKEPR